MTEHLAHSELDKRRRAVLPSWLSTFYAEPIEIDHGQGRHVWDAEGNRYLDFFGGILTTLTGHALPEITTAIQQQAAKVLHTSTLYLNRPMIELAERIAEHSAMRDPRVFFTTSGTEANDAALLLASSYRGSNQVLALRNSYHGRSFSSMSVTGNSGWSASSLSPLQTHFLHGSRRPGTSMAQLTDSELIAACVSDLEDTLEQLHGRVACLIAEPIQGVGGFTAAPDGLFGAMKKVLDRHGILWISDEVQTGWGRTGEHFWGWQAHAADRQGPQVVTFAKGVANGLPLGGVIAEAEVMDAVEAKSISTFGGSPLVSAGALANLDYLLAHDLQGNALRVGEQLKARLVAGTAGLGGVREVRGRGLMLAVDLATPDGEPDPAAAVATMEAARARGLLVGAGGLHGNVLRVAPPLSVTTDEAAEAAEILIAALAAATATPTP